MRIGRRRQIMTNLEQAKGERIKRQEKYCDSGYSLLSYICSLGVTYNMWGEHNCYKLFDAVFFNAGLNITGKVNCSMTFNQGIILVLQNWKECYVFNRRCRVARILLETMQRWYIALWLGCNMGQICASSRSDAWYRVSLRRWLLLSNRRRSGSVLHRLILGCSRRCYYHISNMLLMYTV